MNLREMAFRPDIGRAGRQIAVRSNFFEVEIVNNNMMVTQYYVEIHHPGSRRLDRFIIFFERDFETNICSFYPFISIVLIIKLTEATIVARL